jgi:hypothetical protein
MDLLEISDHSRKNGDSEFLFVQDDAVSSSLMSDEWWINPEEISSEKKHLLFRNPWSPNKEEVR